MKGESFFMNSTNETALLRDVYQNAAMGIESISALLPKVTNSHFRSDLQTQRQEYQTFQTDAENLLGNLKACPEELSGKKRVSLRMSIQMNTLLNSETSHLAEMMIQGSTMGIIDLTRSLNGYTPGDPAVQGLAERMVTMEQNNINRLKAYLQ